MTELEKMQWQSEQDQITLDYSKWSQQRLGAKLSNDHNLWKEQRDDVLARQQASNAETRRKYLAGLEAAKAEKQSERDAEIDRQLEPQKIRLRNEWLANNPNLTEDDFESKAWHLLKANLIEQGEMDNREAMRNSLLKSGRYAV
jgi:hypothetical protein